jgi:hypothetical protein
MAEFACAWEGCQYTTVNRYNVVRHMYTHWPWQLNKFVCTYCEKGYQDKCQFDAHIRSEPHVTQEALAKAQNKPRYHVADFAKNWVDRSIKVVYKTNQL